jgi:tripartite-type tricarboxylate transporter receptor subunit TctC
MGNLAKLSFAETLLPSLALAMFAATATGQSYPTRPIRVIAQFTPGTSTDILARVIGGKLTEAWGHQVVVDNRPGAGGLVGTELGAKAAPDGYTLTMAVSSGFGINPTLYSKLPYDVMRDFAPITNIALTPQTLVASPSFAAKSVKELVAQARSTPGKINYASLGAGSTSHLTMEMFRSAAGLKLNHIPYKGSPAAHAELFSGQIPVMFDAIPAVLPHVKSGRLRGLGIGAAARSPFLPDVPTIAESGFPGFEAVGWIGIAAPSKTPPAILDRLNAEIVRIINTPEMQERLAALAFTPVGDTRAQFSRFIQSEIAKWGKAVRESGARAD